MNNERADSTSGAPPGGRSQKRWWLALGGGTLWISILVHVIFAAVAAYIVVEHFSKKHVDFVATAPPSPHTEVEHKVEMAKKNNAESAPPDLKRITTADLSPISLPDVPETPVTEETTPTTMSGTGEMGDGDIGGGIGGGNATGDDGGGSPVFGIENGSGLEGYLYDLKQTPTHDPTDMTKEHYYEVIAHFIHIGWDEEALSQYYKSPNPLYASAIFIPTLKAEEGPKNFKVENEVKPNLYIIVYHGSVAPNQDGDYRFVGLGDNVLLVRVNGKTVLDAGLQPALGGEQNKYPKGWEDPTDNSPIAYPYSQTFGSLRIGQSFHVDAEETTKIDIVIGEEDGGESAYFLMITRDGDKYENAANGFPKLPVFQIGSDTIMRTGQHPPYSPSTIQWKNVP